ncbi:MAG TPA: hypothetical protein VGK78_06160 [Nocardioides sp.]|uniref:hypothetical protein n=1 Tax=Nocardioides sp. TaxID=35761 RepID=UPI002F4011F6
MTTVPRRAGVALLVYGLGVTAAFLSLGSPGGDYDPDNIASYVSHGHWPAAFALAYMSALCSLALIVLGQALRRSLDGAVGDFVGGLCQAGTTISVVGSFLVGGIDVAMAEGGTHVQTGVPQPVVYTLSEVGNLVAVCGPAFFVGVVALVLAVAGRLPMWLRIFSVVAGLCGILAPFFFTYFVFVIWTIVTGVALLSSRASRPLASEPAPSLV